MVGLRGVLVLLVAAGVVRAEAPWYGGAFSSEVVAADHVVASEAGAAMLAAGGNAVDAAVATSFALSVVRPYSCGVGGGGFMLVRLVDDPDVPGVQPLTVAVDYRERAPAAAGPGYFEDLPDDASRYTGHAVAIPGTVAGLLEAHGRWGLLDREAVLAPAIRAARAGWLVDEHTFDAIETLKLFVDAQEDTGALSPGHAWLSDRFGSIDVVGERVSLPEQAHVLELIAREGRDGFYGGAVARAVVDAVRAHGGSLTLDDLAGYEPVVTAPLRGWFMGYEVLSMPLPSSGGVTMQQALALFEMRRDLWGDSAWMSPVYAHVLIESLKHAFADRATHLGDPEFGAIPVERLMSDAYLRERASMIEADGTLARLRYGSASAPPEDGGTSHFSVVDRWGNCVSCTETINLEFGSRVAVPSFGFVLNNEMDDFLSKRGTVNAFGLKQSERNLPEAGKRPLSSMSPTIVLDGEGRVVATAGASGGPRIITGTMQALLNVVVHGMSAWDAVSLPRVHHQWIPDVVYVERRHAAAAPEAWYSSVGSALIDGLRARGHDLRMRKDVGNVQLIRRSRDGAGWEAACDPRKGGRPAGR